MFIPYKNEFVIIILVSTEVFNYFLKKNINNNSNVINLKLLVHIGTPQVIAALGLEDPGDIAIDHLGDNIYFSDALRGTISVCKSDGSLCTTLKTNAKSPKFVTLDTRNGYGFKDYIYYIFYMLHVNNTIIQFGAAPRLASN